MPWHTLLNVPWPNFVPILKSPINDVDKGCLFCKDGFGIPFDFDDLDVIFLLI